jgi:hypothetical protein
MIQKYAPGVGQADSARRPDEQLRLSASFCRDWTRFRFIPRSIKAKLQP